MPRVFPPFIACVFYIYPTEEDAKNSTETGGTGFFFGEKTKTSPNFPHLYAVTNRHVIYGDGVKKPTLRFNTKNGELCTLPTEQSDWRVHPNLDDIAICPVQFDTSFYDIDFFERKNIFTDEIMQEFDVGEGDDIIMIGRFRTHAGKEKNFPTVRLGNIASMSDEPLNNQFTKRGQESYIVEMRSMSGYSGSPVLLSIPRGSLRFRRPDGSEGAYSTFKGHKVWLFGIDWGHITYREIAEEESTGRKLIIKMDSAMAGVVPVSKLMDLIDSEEMVEMRNKKDKEDRKKKDVSS